MEAPISATFQIIFDSAQMYYNGILVPFSEESLNQFIPQIPVKWWTDKDRICAFTYYSDGSYYCERRKKYFDFSYNQELERTYVFDSESDEEAAKLNTIFLKFFRDCRLIQLREQKDSIRKALEQEFDFVHIQFRNLRDRLLTGSDWTQLSDVSANMEVEKRLQWEKYRQYLRDMPQSDAWKTGDYTKIVFPLSPEEFDLKFPGEEYMSMPQHFQNQVTLHAREMAYRIIKTLALPKINDGVDTEKIINELNPNSIDTDAIDQLLNMVNGELNEIDTSLKIQLKVVPQL